MLEYRMQNAKCTLAGGLAEYYRRHPFLKRGDQLRDDRAREFFRCHDAVHVLYGCDTSLVHEAIVKISSIFGTTGGFSVLKGYSVYDSMDIYGSLGLGDILRTVAVSLFIVPRTLLRCAAQKERWPWSEFDRHLDTPLDELRAQYHILVA